MKRYYRKNRPSVALFLVSNLLAAGSSVFMSFLLGTFADSAMEGDLSRVWKIALVTLVYLCVETFFAFLAQRRRVFKPQRVGRGLRADAVRKIEALSYMEKSEKDDGSCLSLVQNDVDTIQQDYVAALGEIYFQICCFLRAFASAIAIQPVMTLIMIAVSVLTAAFPKMTEKRLMNPNPIFLCVDSQCYLTASMLGHFTFPPLLTAEAVPAICPAMRSVPFGTIL